MSQVNVDYIIRWINDARGAIQAGATANKYEKQLSKLESSLKKTGKAGSDTSKVHEKLAYGFKGLKFSVEDFSKALARVAVVAPVWMLFRTIITSITQAITEAGQAFNEFQKEMGRVATVTTAVGATAAEFKSLEQAAISFASGTIATMKDTATAMYQLSTAGLSAAEALGGFQHVMDLSLATMTDVNSTGKLMAGAFRLFGKEMDNSLSTAEKFQRVADVLATTFKTQQVELSEITTAFGFAANAANSVNFEFEDLVATIGFLNTGLLKGSKSGTALTNAIIKMSKNAKLLEDATGKAFDPTKPIDFVEIMQVLNQRYKEGKLALNDDVQLVQAFGLRGVRAIKSILQRWNEWEAALARNRGDIKNAAHEMREEFENNVAAQIEEMSQKYSEFTSAIATKTTGIAVPALKELNAYLTVLISIISSKSATASLEKLAAALALAFTGNKDNIKEVLSYLDSAGDIFDRLAEKAETSAAATNILTLTHLKLKDVFTIASLAITNNTAAIDRYIESLKRAEEEESKAAQNSYNQPTRTFRTQDEYNRDTELLKAGGASRLRLAEELVHYLKIEKGYEEDVDSLLDAQNKKRAESLKLVVKHAKEIRKMVSESLSDAIQEGDISKFTQTLGEKIRKTIIDNVSESLVNSIANQTNFDILLGEALDGTKVERAIITGADYHANAIRNAMTSGAIGINQTGGTAGIEQGIATITNPRIGIQEQVPVAPAGFATDSSTGKQIAAPKKGFFDGLSFGNVLGAGLLATAFFGGGGSSTQGHTFSGSVSSETSTASTRSSTVAKVTNIQISPVFQLDGASINDQNTIQESAKKMADLMKEDLLRILEDADVATGNV